MPQLKLTQAGTAQDGKKVFEIIFKTKSKIKIIQAQLKARFSRTTSLIR